MKIVVVLFVLVLITLDIGGAAASEATVEEKKADEAKCNADCAEKKLEPALCKEACDVTMHFKTVVTKEIECRQKCSPPTEPCQVECKKEYEAKEKEATASCNAVCKKAANDQPRHEACMKTCTPALILKALGEAVEQALKKQ